MHVIQARNVNDAYVQGLTYLHEAGVWGSSRAGEVLVAPGPVVTATAKPTERVLFDAKRDANCVFHLMEALWMLVGRNDATWLDQFVGDFSKRFAEEDGHMHGAYGFRWRRHFDMEAGGMPYLPDQLEAAITFLKNNPDDRQVVVTMWDPVADLGVAAKDKPCNTHIYLRIRTEQHHKVDDVAGGKSDQEDRLLDLTVCCRSNDAVWGAHGANAVHFSILQEYLAARIGVGIGTFYQFSNNYHVYKPLYEKLWPAIQAESRAQQSWYDTGAPTPIVTLPEFFDRDLALFFGDTWADRGVYYNRFFDQVAVPLRRSYAFWREGEFGYAREIVRNLLVCDWTVAASEWYARRAHKQAAR